MQKACSYRKLETGYCLLETMMSFKVVTLPETLDCGAIDDLTRRFEALRQDAVVRSVILTGAGDHFSIGLEPHAVSSNEAIEHSRRGQALTATIEGLEKPVIAAINGKAVDGGLEIALACTWRICSDQAEFGFSPTGIIPGFGGTLRLSRTIGKARAHELLLTGRRINSAEALAMGLVNQTLPDRSQLMIAAEEIAHQIGRNAPLAIKYALQAINYGSEMPLEDGLKLESALFGLCFATLDVREGTMAFLEKRSADFKGK